MMGLDPKYIASRVLQEHLTDKDTGNFLRNGYVLFFKDNARSVDKPVFQLTGSPPNYGYIEYGFFDVPTGGWRIDLNSQGAFDVKPYFYPYDADGNIELYFVEVYSVDVSIVGPVSIFQFSLQAFPPDVGSGPSPSGNAISVNYIPNGQLLLHNDLPTNGIIPVNQVRAPITDIAYGGFTFERPIGSTAKDYIIFQRFGSFVTTPDESPRYALEVQCQVPNAGDTFKDVRIRFDDVNKFNSTDSTKLFTFSFYGIDNAGSGLPVTFLIYKNYGTGGSTPTETIIQTFTLTGGYQQFFVPFSFGNNTAETIGPNDDDYLQLVLRLPTDIIFDASFDNFILTDGNVTMPFFPDTPNSEFKYQGIAGFMPVPDPLGFDLYLPLRLTPTGLEFDRGEVGKICPIGYNLPNVGELLCDGMQYDSQAYSTDGIPYARLQKVLFNTTLLAPSFGTGQSFVTTYSVDSSLNSINLASNRTGSVTAAAADGTPATGFSFSNVYTGLVTNYDAYGYYVGENIYYIWDSAFGTINPPTAGTSGFAFVGFLNPAPTGSGVTDTRARIQGQTIPASTLAGKYWEFSTTLADYYMWFTVDGTGVDPLVPGRLPIHVALTGTDSSLQVARNVAMASSNFQTDRITTVVGSSIPAGSNWTFSSPTNDFYVWYTVDGVGTDPAYLNKVGIKVQILSTDTADQVATKTVTSINSRYFQVPDTRGYFLRGVDTSGDIDPGLRGSTNGITFGNTIGSIEFDGNLQHTHLYDQSSITAGTIIGSTAPTGTLLQTDQFVSATGIEESRGINIAVNYVIKY